MAAGAMNRVLAAIAAIGTLASIGSPACLAQSGDLLFADAFEAAAPPPPPAGTWAFENVTTQRLDSTPNSSYRFDAAWVDFNNDGCYDAFVFDHSDSSTSRLWLNRCDGSHRFTLVANDQARYYISTPSNILGSGWMTLLDFNGDGRQDFFLRHAQTPAGRYLNATAASSAGTLPYFSEKQFGCDNPCAFADINGDGELDIINDTRRVERMLARTQLLPAAGSAGQRIAGDLDNDGWPDLVQPAGGGWWRNDRGTLTWRSALFSGGIDQHALADFDNDGDLDLFSLDGDWTQSSGRALLFANDGTGNFTDVTSGAGLTNVEFGAYYTDYGNTIAADLDNDGWQDLVIAGSGYSSSVALYRNLGAMRFARMTVNLGASGSGSEAYKARAGIADFDGDGRLDIAKTQAGTNIGIWRNINATGGNRWMKVRVRGTALNSDGLGTTVRWYIAGTQTLIAHMEVQANVQHAQTWLHAGLGSATTVDVVVRYPHGGPVHTLRGLSSNQEIVVYPNGCSIRNWQAGNGWPLSAPAGCT
jgi:hypothetical protein